MAKGMVDRLGNPLKVGDHVHFDAPTTSLICRIVEMQEVGQIAQVGGMRGGKQAAVVQPASMKIVTEFVVASPDIDRPCADNCLKLVVVEAKEISVVKH